MADPKVAAWPRGTGAISLVLEDLEATGQSYQHVLGLPVRFEDEDSAVFDFGNTIINLLKTSAAREPVEPAPGGTPGGRSPPPADDRGG